MGVRLYNPTLGRFLQMDPVFGGNATTYGYPQDPINLFDLNGQWGCGWCHKAVSFVQAHYRAATQIVISAVIVIGVCGVSAGVGCALAVGFATSYAWAAVNRRNSHPHESYRATAKAVFYDGTRSYARSIVNTLTKPGPNAWKLAKMLARFK